MRISGDHILYRKEIFITDLDNRELITSVEYITAGGFAIPPILVISGKAYRETSFSNNFNNNIL